MKRLTEVVLGVLVRVALVYICFARPSSQVLKRRVNHGPTA